MVDIKTKQKKVSFWQSCAFANWPIWCWLTSSRQISKSMPNFREYSGISLWCLFGLSFSIIQPAVNTEEGERWTSSIVRIMDPYQFMCVPSTNKSVESRQMELSGRRLEGSELWSIFTPSAVTLFFSLSQLSHNPLWSVKGIFLISLSPLHSVGLMNGGLQYQSLPPTLTTRLRVSIHKQHISGASNEMDTVLLWVGSLFPERKTLLGDLFFFFFFTGDMFGFQVGNWLPLVFKRKAEEDDMWRLHQGTVRIVFIRLVERSPWSLQIAGNSQEIVNSASTIHSEFSDRSNTSICYLIIFWTSSNSGFWVGGCPLVVVNHGILPNNKDMCLFCRISQLTIC